MARKLHCPKCWAVLNHGSVFLTCPNCGWFFNLSPDKFDYDDYVTDEEKEAIEQYGMHFEFDIDTDS